MKSTNILIVFPVLILGFGCIGAFASEELPIGEATPIGVVGGVTYLATLHEPCPAEASFEIKSKAENVYKTIADLTFPAAENYYAGVSPNGKYFYIAAEKDSATSGTDCENSLYIYEFGKDEPVLEHTDVNYDILETNFGTRFSWERGKLYYVVSSSTGGLGAISYEADPQTGEVNARLPDRPPISEQAFQELEHLRSKGYPVYDKNVTICTGITSPSDGEFVVLRTGDEKDRVVEFYVAAGGTPEYENGAVVFRDWEMPVGVRINEEGDSTVVVYDVLGCVYNKTLEEPIELSESEIETLGSLRARGFPVYDNNVTYIEYFDYPNVDEFYELHTRDDEDTVVQFFVDAGGTPEHKEGFAVFNDWDMPIYIAGQGPYAKLTIIYYGPPSV